ncbi:hypothetical protein [Arthrobacter sp. NPDC056493]|uniref:hypothetical protein n=1 Tax=Arthrobacter sp. NPDC056493 TaxID=3345839 RepID=UPI0036711F88
MKRRFPTTATAAATAAQPTAIAASVLAAVAVRTGEHCPQTGWWYPLQSASVGAGPAEPTSAATGPAPRFVGQGSVMPAVGGSPSLWLKTAPQ